MTLESPIQKILLKARSYTNEDLLRLYIKNHYVSFHYYILAFALFLAARLYLYGMPDLRDAGLFLPLLAVSFFALSALRRKYKYWQTFDDLSQRSFSHIIVQIVSLRALFLLSWMIFLFGPFSSAALYDHLLGYGFVFFAIALYSSVSAPVYGLMLFDIIFITAISGIVTILSPQFSGGENIQYFIMIFAFFSLLISWKSYKSAQQFVRNERKLRDAAKKSEHSHRAKSDFLAVMSHEIRTPMAGIMGMIDFLKDTKLDREQEECLETITRCSHTLLNTLNDILDISKIEEGKLSIDHINFDFRGFVRGTKRSFDSLSKEKGVEFKVSIDDNVPKFIHSDPNRLQQIIFNFISNAFKFTSDGCIHLKVKMSNDVIHIEVHDTGIGIKEQDKEKLFQKFSQVDGSIARKYGGSGMGLFIANNLAHCMDGSMGVSSEDGKGSVFWVKIPYIEPVEDQQGWNAEDMNRPARPLDILLVDDNELNRSIIKRYLEEHDHNIIDVSSGYEALEKVETLKPDVILMDMNMPDMDGIETTKRIKQLGEPYRNIPVIALTANVLEKDVQACRDAGMVDHLFKPIHSDRMYRTIYKHVQKGDNLNAEGRTGADQAISEGGHDEPPHKAAILIEELGSDYAYGFIARSLSEVMKHIEDIEAALGKEDIEAAHNLAHDLTALSGNIGMEQTSAQSRALEKLCSGGDVSDLHGLLLKLIEQAKKEKITIEQIIDNDG